MARRELMEEFFNVGVSGGLDSPTSTENDYGILNIINSYRDREDDYLDRYKDVVNTSKNEITKTFEENENSSILFTNSVIQNSIIRMNIVKKFMHRKGFLIIQAYFKTWKERSKRQRVASNNTECDNARDYLNMNRKVIEDFCNKDESLSYIKSEASVRGSTQIYSGLGQLAIFLKGKLKFCLKSVFCEFLFKLKEYSNSKKVVQHNLTLLYLFTQLTIAKNKKPGSNDDEAKIKLNDYERKISKLEIMLNEKANIISRKNDVIEHLTTENDSLRKKNNGLNIITESLCQKCGNSLEESFISHSHTPKNKDFSLSNEEEYKRTIQEQLDYILKLEQDCKEYRNKYMDYRSKNEMLQNELEIIKIEFKNISDNLVKKDKQPNYNSKESSVQTDALLQATVVNNNVSSVTKPKQPKKKPLSAASGKFPSKTVNNNTLIINNTNLQPSSSTNINFDYLDDSKEIQTLKFNNSILSQEIVNLNKELTRLKNESKQYTDVNKKLDKEKTELLSKFKQKTDNYDKIKKENEQLMILINTSNYKSFITSEVT
jgi:hypothetical protein